MKQYQQVYQKLRNAEWKLLFSIYQFVQLVTKWSIYSIHITNCFGVWPDLYFKKLSFWEAVIYLLVKYINNFKQFTESIIIVCSRYIMLIYSNIDKRLNV